MTKFSRFTMLSLALAILLVPSFGFAQTSSTTGAIYGTVTDTSGGVLPGVTVTASSPQLQGSRTATTDAKGEYVLPLLPPGTYKLEFNLTGLKPVVQQNVTVGLSQSTKQDAKLSLGAVSETVTVTASQVVVDPTQTTQQQNFKEEHLKYASIGQAGRSYQSVLGQAAGSGGPNGSGGPGGGGNPQVFGSNLGQNQWRLDGLNSTDPVTHTFSTNLVFDAIQEISLQTAGYEAEYGKATGGVVNVITKSGGNDFSGSADVRLSNQHMTQKGHKRQESNASALAYNRDIQNFKNWGPQATIGGPIQRDKLWFFLSGQRLHNHNVPPNVNGFQPGDRQFIGYNTFGKLTSTFTPNQTASFKYTYNPALIPFAQNNSSTPQEAARDQYQTTRIYNLGYDAILSSQWLANVQVGRQLSFLKSSPHSGNLTLSGAVDQGTGLPSINYTNVQESDRDRDELIASTSYFWKGAGTHQFKVGTDLDRSKFNALNFLTGTPPEAAMCSPTYKGVETGQPGNLPCGAELLPNRGAPFELLVQTQLPELDYKSNARTFYAQDEWRPVDRLTAKIGLRYDAQTFKHETGETALTLSKYQPRLGFTYDIFNNANSVVHGHWGRFMDDNALTLSSYLSKVGAVSTFFIWTGSEWVTCGVAGGCIQGGASGNALDPTLKPTYADETNIGFTQRITRDSSLDITGIYKQSHDIFEDSCLNGTCSNRDVNGNLVPADTRFWMTNRPGGQDVLKQKYQGVVTKYEWHPTWGNIIGSYTWAKSQGSIEYTQNAGGDFDVFPVNFINRYGYLSDDARHRVKIDGFVRAPYGFIVGANWYWDSGTPYNVTATCNSSNVNRFATLKALCPTIPGTNTLESNATIYVEPRGSRRLSPFKQLDLQLQKNFTFGGQTFGLIGSIFNVFNKETVVGRNGTFTSSLFTTSNNWQRPRRFEVGARYEF